MIKTYSELNNSETDSLFEFIKSNSKQIRTFDEMDELFSSKTYDFGNGILCYFLDKKIIASTRIVLDLAETLKTAYIHKLFIEKKYRHDLKIIGEIISKSSSIAKNYGAKDIRLGICPDMLSIKEQKKLNITINYKSYKMTLNDFSIKQNTLQIEELTQKNKLTYLNTYNNSFSDMPHGIFIRKDALERKLKEKNEQNAHKQNYFYLILDENKNYIGFMDAFVENGGGEFDIGLKRAYRNMGYGKKLLETAIQFLISKKVKKISLIVIGENSVAFNMYRKRGFVTEITLGDWFKL